MTETHGPFVPYHPIKARSSSSAEIGDSFTALHIRAYIKSQQVPTSTLDEFEYFMQRSSKGKDVEQDPFRALFRVINDDTSSLVDVIRISMKRIREDTLNEGLIEKRVTFWRRLLYRLNFSLAEIDQQLRAFVQFGYKSELRPFNLEHRELLSKQLAEDSGKTLRRCVELLEKSSSSFLAEMQIVNSERSIAEAESVSKLTELAFVFIPLSFAASVFSMQIHELDGGVSLYIFVTIAIGFVLIAYIVRLSIRSSRLTEYQRNVLETVRDDADLQYNQPIPTHTFLAWSGKAMGRAAWKGLKGSTTVIGPLVLTLAVIGALLSPIILLWIRGISKGFSAVITVLLLLLDGVLVYPVVVTASGTFELKEVIREIQRNHEINQKRKEKLKKLRKGKGRVDPEAPNVESSIEMDSESERRNSL